VLDLVAQKHKVPFLHPGSVLLANRYYICRRFREDYTPIRETYRRLLSDGSPCDDGYNYLKQFRHPETRTTYQFHLLAEMEAENREGFLKRMLRIAKSPILWCLGVAGEIKLRTKAKTDPTLRYNFNLYKSLPSIKLHRNWLGMWRRLDMVLRPPFQEGPLPDNYVFLTLHLQPEASTCVFSPFFVNEQAVIDGVSRALPLGWKLVVKPHPLMIGIEPPSFYRWIQSIPNVQLVTPHADTQRLIRGARVVLAITGTSGFEAALWGKKVIVLSNRPIWSMIDGVTVCTDFTELHNVLRDAEHYEPDDNNLAAYLQAVHDHSFPLEKNYIWRGPYDLSDPGYKQAMDEIARQLVEAYRAYQESRT